MTRLSYCILDIDNLLEGKESPVDKGKESFLRLITDLKYRFKI